MSLSSTELWQRIAAEGLASPMQCRAWAAEAAKSMPVADTTDGLKVLQQLVQSGKLTQYQAASLSGQSDRPLRKGPWHILRRLQDPLWNGWMEVAQIDPTKADPLQPLWALWIAPQELENLRASAPALPRGIQLAGVSGDHLQHVHMPELVDGELKLQVGPLAGKLLTDAFPDDRPSVSESNQIVRQLGGGAACMHAVDMVHGRILPDRVYWDGKNATLARDPISVLTATLDPAAVGLLGEHLGDLTSVQFLAPEFIAPGQTPTLCSDVYSLGCLWWWLLTGQPPAGGKDSQSILASHAEGRLRLPGSVDLPAPLERVLQHALAKNPSSRFESAVQFCEAFDQSQEVIRAGRQPVSPPTPNKADGAPHSTRQASQPDAPSQESSSAEKAAAPSAAAGQSRNAGAARQEKKKRRPADGQPAVESRSVPQSKSAVQPTSVAADDTSAEPAQRAKSGDSRVTAASPKPRRDAAAASEALNAAQETVPQETPERAPPEQETTAQAPERLAADTQAQAESQPGESESKPAVVARDASTSREKSAALQSAPRPTSVRRVRRRKRRNPWLLPTVGGCGFLIVLLLGLKLSGVLEPSSSTQPGPTRPAYVPPPSDPPEVKPQDPRLEFYRIVDSAKDNLWAPPAAPSPLPRELLPPGAQLFVSFRPHIWLGSETHKNLLGAFEPHLANLLLGIAQRAGQPLEAIQHVTAAFYSPTIEGATPQSVLRVELRDALPLSRLKTAWQNPVEQKVGIQTLLVNGSGNAYYISEQPLVAAQSVKTFSVGPAELLREVVDMEGHAGPLTLPVEKLWKRSDAEADLCLLGSPPYLFTEGRGLLATAPPKLAALLRDLLGKDMRGGLMQMRLEPQWYFEVDLIGASDQDAGRVAATLEDKLTRLPSQIESWFVEQSPHPYWRALAIRYPQMLGALATHSRFGVEDGIAIANTYLPREASVNVLLASWIALQDGATLAGALEPGGETTAAVQPLTLEEYLARPITVRFDQEPIEVALQLIGEEANQDLPPGTPKLQFILDGDAFELAGITRNQQLQQFSNVDQSLRQALTEVAKRGNPVTTVTDTREQDQKLIWVVREAPDGSGAQIISLTTRTAATEAGIPLPVEFASP